MFCKMHIFFFLQNPYFYVSIFLFLFSWYIFDFILRVPQIGDEMKAADIVDLPSFRVFKM